jgi:hypothetical protein
MYHSVIGKRLVTCVNQREGTEYTVREFFDEVYIPLFFANSRLLQHVNNSPFAQEFTAQKKAFTIELRDACLDKVHKKVENEEPDASFFLGGPASNATDGTSGQVTSLKIPISEEDVYASWIGAALGLTVRGGYTLLIDADDVLMTTYEGWREYRRFLDQSPKIKPLQVNAWNGQWVASRMAKSIFFEPAVDKEGAALEMQSWVQLLFALSYHYREGPTPRLLAYVYSLGQSNTTLGFVQLNLPDVKRLVDLYNQLFSVPAGMPAARFEALYQTEESFRVACTHTEIGLRALKPKDVFNAQRGIPKPPNAAESEKQIAFNTYQTWIIAMLNNKELLQRAEELAAALDHFRRQDERGKVVHKQMVEELLDQKNRRDFIDALTKLLEKDSSNCTLFERAVYELLSLSPDNVPLFLTLLRFKYAAVRAKA